VSRGVTLLYISTFFWCQGLRFRRESLADTPFATANTATHLIYRRHCSSARPVNQYRPLPSLPRLCNCALRSLGLNRRSMADSTLPSTAPPETINSTTDIDPSFYTWQTWFKALSGSITEEEAKKYRQARDVIKEESDCKRCEQNRDWLFENSK
jgi:hypothetical protein